MERETATKFIHELLDLMVKQKGSDLFITAGFPPAIKVDGKIAPVSKTALTPQHTIEIVRSVMNDKQAAEFESTKECNFAISPPGIGRFRVNAFVQQGRVGMVLRTITTDIPKFEDLGLPPVLKDIIMSKRGIMMFIGATGAGKSTSMASLLGYRNENSYGHIITIEDPIEFVHEHRNCILTQREVGVDCDGWQVALKNTLRQAPDVILIGEVRDRETMEAAIRINRVEMTPDSAGALARGGFTFSGSVADFRPTIQTPMPSSRLTEAASQRVRRVPLASIR
jgi:twitching motility protein PilU